MIAYEDAVRDDAKWEKIAEKINNNIFLTTEDYEIVMSQTGLGKSAFDSLVFKGRMDKIKNFIAIVKVSLPVTNQSRIATMNSLIIHLLQI